MIQGEVRCRRCRYDLHGLRADRRCPECGLPVWESIRATVDPRAASLPQLRNPAAVGDGLLWLMTCMLLATLLIAARPLAAALGAIDASFAPWIVWLTSPAPRLYSACVALAGLYAVWLLLPPRGEEPGSAIRRNLRYISIGLILWAAILIGEAALLRTTGAAHAAMALLSRALLAGAAVVGLVGTDGVFRTIGERSRQYRTSQGGRQSVQAMIAAVAVELVGELLRTVGREGWVHRNVAVWGRNILWIAMIMLVIGLCYLAVNAWWIRHALRRPPPRLEDLIGHRPQRG